MQGFIQNLFILNLSFFLVKNKINLTFYKIR